MCSEDYVAWYKERHGDGDGDGGPCKERHGGRSRLVTAPGKLLCTSLQCNPFCTSMYLHLNVFDSFLSSLAVLYFLPPLQSILLERNVLQKFI